MVQGILLSFTTMWGSHVLLLFILLKGKPIYIEKFGSFIISECILLDHIL